jgi:hypothetical protein
VVVGPLTRIEPAQRAPDATQFAGETVRSGRTSRKNVHFLDRPLAEFVTEKRRV